MTPPPTEPSDGVAENLEWVMSQLNKKTKAQLIEQLLTTAADLDELKRAQPAPPSEKELEEAIDECRKFIKGQHPNDFGYKRLETLIEAAQRRTTEKAGE